MDTRQTNRLSEDGTHTDIPYHATLDTSPVRVTLTPTVAPSTAAPVNWLTKAEFIASIPPEGIEPDQLIPRFRGRIRNDEELLDWITESAKWDPSTNIFWLREPSQRDQPEPVD